MVDELDGQMDVRRSALFVDFDNVYLGLVVADPSAAEIFATSPDRLLAWLAVGEDETGKFRRRFLTRICYLNPGPFGQFRSFYTSTGFRVVDCPSLALAHDTRYDEFVVCSADADFTPLMARIRAHDRRTTMVAAGPASTAYQSVCDESLEAAQLISALRPVAGTSKVSGDYASLPASSSAADNAVSEDALPSNAAEVVASGSTDDEIARRAARAAVAAADGPLALAAVANAARQAAPTVKTRWDQEGGFAAWLERRVPDLLVVPSPQGGSVLLDPTRHESPGDGLPARVCRVTRVPPLSSDQYAAVFRELSDYLSTNDFQLTATSRSVRDRCVEQDQAVSRAAVNFILQGLLYAGIDLRRTPAPRAAELARAWSGNVVALAENARMELTDADRAELDSWILGSLATAE